MNVLVELEQRGYTFRLAGDQVMVRGPGLGDPATVERIRRKKPDILREIMVREIITLVRITAACDHHVLLHRDAIAAEFRQDDIDELAQTDRVQRQAWAAAIAYRLTRPGPGWDEAEPVG